jgi:D-alanyl-D-alanine carboxypeptidase
MLTDYRGMDGIKTGYISDSGFNLVASAQRGNERLIGVVFGGRSAHSRNAHMRDILNRGFARLNSLHIAAHAPVPGHKPAKKLRVASRDDTLSPPRKPRGGSIALQSRDAGAQLGKIANLRDIIPAERFAELFGQGDYSAGRAKRMRTGLMAIAAHTRAGGRKLDLDAFTHSRQTAIEQTHQKRTNAIQPPTDKPGRGQKGSWSIQLGAYESRAQTEKVLRKASLMLKRRYQHRFKALIAPRRAEDRKGWLYRARITGLNKDNARNACQLFSTCMTIAPAR